MLHQAIARVTSAAACNTRRELFHRPAPVLRSKVTACTSTGFALRRVRVPNGYTRAGPHQPAWRSLHQWACGCGLVRIPFAARRSAMLTVPAATARVGRHALAVGRSTRCADRGIQRGFASYVRRPVSDTVVVATLIGANVLVFAGWHTLNQRLMYKHFTLSNYGMSHGLLHTLVTSMFSHAGLSHLAVNMFTLYFFATTCMQVLGQRRFLGLYLGGGIVSGMCFLAYNKLLPHLNIPAAFRRGANTAALGASGAVNAVVMFTVCVAPRAKVLLYGIVPVPAALFGLGFVGWDLYGAWAGNSSTANAGHLGGALAGVLYFLFIRRRLLWRRF